MTSFNNDNHFIKKLTSFRPYICLLCENVLSLIQASISQFLNNSWLTQKSKIENYDNRIR